MGHVREERATKILENTLLEWLEDGTIPTSEQLQEAYDAAAKEHGDLTRSGLRDIKLPDRWEQSSATQHNNVIDALSDDIDVLLKALVSITNLGISALGEWNSRSKSLDTRIRKLKARIESLLLLKSDAAGYVSFVEDDFFSLEKVSNETTASVDTRTGEVVLNTDRSDGEGEFQGTQIDLASIEVSWSEIESNNIRFSTNPAGSSLSNITNDRHRRWGLEANALRADKFRTANINNKTIVGELKLKLPPSTKVSKIVLIASEATAGDNSVIGAQYSTDGYTWENVPSESPIQSGVGNFIWRFENTEMKWIKFIASKSSPDESLTQGSTYDFGFERVKIYSEIFEVLADGVDLVSETLTPTLGDEDITFGRASLEVCEEVPTDCSLRYFIRAYNGSTYSNWVQVSPLSREIEAFPAVVDFSAPAELSSEDLTTTFDSSLDTEALNILRKDGAGNLSYRFGGPNDTVANFYIAQQENFLTDFVLVRNLGYSAAKFPSSSAGDLLVGDIQCGWGLEGDSLYYCVFLINNPDGISIDLGSSQAVLDGRVISGTTSISSGWHTFKTDRANWGPLTGTAPTTATELEALDPLYPYNHKYLIEGYNYPSTWDGDQIYLGSDLYGQYLANRIGRHNFLRADLDMSIYSTDVISGPQTIVLLKYDSSRPNHQNERIRFHYTRRFDSFEGIQFKAVLKGTEERTPSLSSYRVRVK